MAKDRKERLGVVYSTENSFEYNSGPTEETVTLPADKQRLKVSFDAKGRKGKPVTLVAGFVGKEDDLEELSKKLKNKLGVGGSAKDGEILLQGNFVDKTKALLAEMGYKTK